MGHYYFGLDLGQRRDHTAVAVVEREEPVLRGFDYVSYLRTQTPLETRFAVRYLERMPLGTSYPVVVREVREMTRRPEVQGQCTLVVDATGVGQAVLDLLREADLDCEVIAVTITGGAAARREGGNWCVPKRDLIGAMQVLLEQRRLKFASDAPYVGKLLEELMSMQTRMSDRDGVQFGAWRQGEHDDLALAAALALWRAKGNERRVGEQGCGRLPLP